MPKRRDLSQGLGDVKAAASWLGRSELAIRKMVERRQVPFVRVRGRVMFPRAEVERFIEQCEGVSVDEALENVQAAQ